MSMIPVEFVDELAQAVSVTAGIMTKTTQNFVSRISPPEMA
jgi:hypothetical protein